MALGPKNQDLRPAGAASGPRRWLVEMVVAAAAAALLVWLGTWGYSALASTRQVGERSREAVALADGLATAAGRALSAGEGGTKQLAAEGARLVGAHGDLIERVFVTAQGGVDEFGIARGAAITLHLSTAQAAGRGGEAATGAKLPDALRQTLLSHEKGVIAAAERAVSAHKPLDWSRLIAALPEGRAVVAVPYRASAEAPVGGIAGLIMRAAPPAPQAPAWVWIAPLVAALLTLGALLAGLPVLGAGVAGQLAAAALVVLAAPAALGPAADAAAGAASAAVIPHTALPINAALDAAEAWLVGGLLILALILGSILSFSAGLLRAMRADPTPYAYVGPAMAATAVLIFVPFFVGVGLSFTAADGTFIGIDNYVEVIRSLSDPSSATHFSRTLLHTIIWTALNVTAHVTIGLGLALVLNRPDLKGRKLYRLLLIVPWAVPNYITALIWKWMFNTQYGPVNVMLGLLGVESVDWLGQSVFTNFAANLITNIWLGFPFMMVISLGALQSIPADLYEAAAIDGASAWQKFRHITVPLLKPALFPAIILGTIWTFNAFNVIYLVSGGGPDHQTEILITEAYYLFTVLRRMGLAAAYSVFIFLLLMAYTLITNRLTSATEAVDE